MAFHMFLVLFFLSYALSSSKFMLLISSFPFSDWFIYFIHVCIYSYYNPPFFESDVSVSWSFVTWMRALLSFIWFGYLIVNVWLYSLVAWQQVFSKYSSSNVRFDTPHSWFYSKHFCWLYPHYIFPLDIIK